MIKPIDIILADDHTLVRRTIRALLHSKGAFEVVAEAADGQEALQLVDQLHPTVAILDVRMPKVDGIEATRRMRKLPSPPKVLVLSVFATRDVVFKAFEAGCIAYVLKGHAQELGEAIHAALAGRRFLSTPLRHLEPELEARFGR